jgi:uncharacterized membrane protein YoaK (UPF0700 family)
MRAGVQPVRPLVLATALTAIAGFLDAVAFIALNHVYVSFMSGNSTHLGISIALGDARDAMSLTLVVIAFALGTCCGTWLSDSQTGGATVQILAAETATLLGAWILASSGQLASSLVLIATAMGMQNCLHQFVGGADVGKGFITGALFGLGEALARVANGRSQWRTIGSNFLSWGAFVVGATVGVMVLQRAGMTACIGLAFAFVLCVLTAKRFRIV